MTTIAYDGKMLVSDSQSTVGEVIYEEDCPKLFPNVGPFAALAIAGDYQAAMDVIDVIRDYNRIERIRNLDFEELGWKCRMLGVTHDGALWHYTGTYSFEMRKDVPFAIGTGAHFALGAMGAGADAKQAVIIAARYDLSTNTNLQIANLIEDDEEEEAEDKLH